VTGSRREGVCVARRSMARPLRAVMNLPTLHGAISLDRRGATGNCASPRRGERLSERASPLSAPKNGGAFASACYHNADSREPNPSCRARSSSREDAKLRTDTVAVAGGARLSREPNQARLSLFFSAISGAST
jgi:hypothetical protein